MYYNRDKELKKYKKYRDAWNISKKYSNILMKHDEYNKHIMIFPSIRLQYINELRNKKIPFKNKPYIQCWDTVKNTILNNPKLSCKIASIKILHLTNIQRSYIK